MYVTVDLNSLSELSLCEICDVCFLVGDHILPYLQDVVLRSRPLERLRVRKHSAATFWCLNEIKDMESRRHAEMYRPVRVKQICATTKVRKRQNDLVVKTIEPLFDIFDLTVEQLQTLTSKQVLHIFTAVIYKSLIAMSDKTLAMSNDTYSLRLASLMRQCISSSLKMRQKLKAVFSVNSFRLYRIDRERDIYSLTVEFKVG